jgi:hypothetical protein
MKQYLNLPDAILKKIIRLLLDALEEEGVDLFNDEEIFEYIGLFNNDLKFFSIEIDDEEDFTYFVSLLRLNPNFETSPIIRPTLNEYSVDYIIDESLYKVTTYNHMVKSYLPITNNILRGMEDNDMIYMWEGRIVDEEYLESDVEKVRTNIERIKKQK